MKKIMLKRWNSKTNIEPVRTMKTRSMTKKEAPYFDRTEYDKYHNNNSEYKKEQEQRRLKGIEPIIICMGGPYSDVWYPPHN